MFQGKQDRVERMAGADSGMLEPGTSPINPKTVVSEQSEHLRPSAMVNIWKIMGHDRSLLLVPAGLALRRVDRTRYRQAKARLGARDRYTSAPT